MLAVKICGIRRVEHALVAADAGADYIGIVFAPGVRRVEPDAARILVQELRQRASRPPSVVGVFVNAPVDEMERIAALCGLDYVQLSGDESLEDALRIKRPVIKAVHVRPDAEATALEAALRSVREAGLLPMLDARAGEAYGGSGRAFDWGLVGGLSARYRFLLAGGLTPENVGEAVRRVRPWGVDVSSGVETGGVKDAARIRAFVKAARAADAAATSV